MDNRSNGSGKQKKDQENTSWTKDPSLAGLDPAKLAMLNSFAQQGAGKNPQELLPLLMAAASQSRAKGTRFSREEMDAIIQVLKAGKSPEETARMDNAALDCEDVFLISAGFSSRIHCRSSTRALTTACSLTLLRSAIKMTFFYPCFPFKTAADKDRSYRIPVCSALGTCKAGNRQGPVCPCRCSSSFRHFFCAFPADSTLLF